MVVAGLPPKRLPGLAGSASVFLIVSRLPKSDPPAGLPSDEPPKRLPAFLFSTGAGTGAVASYSFLPPKVPPDAGLKSGSFAPVAAPKSPPAGAPAPKRGFAATAGVASAFYIVTPAKVPPVAALKILLPPWPNRFFGCSLLSTLASLSAS